MRVSTRSTAPFSPIPKPISITTTLKTAILAFFALGVRGAIPTASNLTQVSVNTQGPTLFAGCAQLNNTNIRYSWLDNNAILDRVLTTDFQQVSSQRTISRTSTNFQPKNLALIDGGSLDLWTEVSGTTWQIVFQHYDKNNANIGGITQAFSGYNEQANADIIRLNDGRIVISCTVGQFDIGHGQKGFGIIYQGFTPSMTPIPSFKGTAYGTNKGDHDHSSMARTLDGGFNICFSVQGTNLCQKISSSNQKIGPPKRIPGTGWQYHPSAIPLPSTTLVASAATTSSQNTVNSYQYATTLTHTFATPPHIPWTKIWMTFQSYLKAIPDPFGGFTLLGRVNNSIVQQHFIASGQPSGPLQTITTDTNPYLQVSGCPTTNGWAVVVSKTKGLFAQLFTLPKPTPSPTPAPTLSPTPAPTSLSTLSPTPPLTSSPTPTPTFSPLPPHTPTSSPTDAPTPAPTPAPTHLPPSMPIIQPSNVYNYFLAGATICVTFSWCIVCGIFGYIRYKEWQNYQPYNRL